MAEGEGSPVPISYPVVEFAASQMTGQGLPVLVDLVNERAIRILDLAFVAKGQDGSLGIIPLADLDHDGAIDRALLEGVSSGLVSLEDLTDAAPVIAPRSSGAHLHHREPLGSTSRSAVRATATAAAVCAAGPVRSILKGPSRAAQRPRRPPVSGDPQRCRVRIAGCEDPGRSLRRGVGASVSPHCGHDAPLRPPQRSGRPRCARDRCPGRRCCCRCVGRTSEWSPSGASYGCDSKACHRQRESGRTSYR